MKYRLTVKPGSSVKNLTGSWRESYPVIDREICNSCRLCVYYCPEGVCFITKKKNKAGKYYAACDLRFCKGCAICAKECPVKAIVMLPEGRQRKLKFKAKSSAR